MDAIAAVGATSAATDSGKMTNATTISGAEFRDFYQNHWPSKDWYHDDVGFEFENETAAFILADDARTPWRLRLPCLAGP